MVVVVPAIAVSGSIRCAGIRRWPSRDTQVRPGVGGYGIGEDVSLLRINEKAAALLVVTIAGVSSRRRFDRRVSSYKSAGDGRGGIVPVRCRDTGSAVAALSAVDDDLATGVVIHHHMGMARARSTVRAYLRPAIGARSVFPGISAGGSVHTHETAIEQNFVHVGHVDHRAFLAVARVRSRVR